MTFAYFPQTFAASITFFQFPKCNDTGLITTLDIGACQNVGIGWIAQSAQTSGGSACKVYYARDCQGPAYQITGSCKDLKFSQLIQSIECHLGLAESNQ